MSGAKGRRLGRTLQHPEQAAPCLRQADLSRLANAANTAHVQLSWHIRPMGRFQEAVGWGPSVSHTACRGQLNHGSSY
jgi:hypothetical protein